MSSAITEALDQAVSMGCHLRLPIDRVLSEIERDIEISELTRMFEEGKQEAGFGVIE
jgi:hypothetical protein